MEKLIIEFRETRKIACDEKCDKAWGINNRPRVYPEISESIIFGVEGNFSPEEGSINLDNYAYCSDDELGEAPENPGTYEGGEAKPTNKSEMGNKWCVRECERCVMSKKGKLQEPLELKDFSKRIYNIYPHTRP